MGTIKLKKPAKAKAQPELKYDKYQIPYYEEIPPSFRVATLQDFWSDKEQEYIYKKPYLIHSEVHPNRYYALRTRLGFTERNDFWIFLRKERIYVLDI